MGIIDMWGFEWGTDGLTGGVEREGLNLTSGSDVRYVSSEIPLPLGGSSMYVRCLNNGTSTLLAPLQASPSGSQFWLHFQWYANINNTANDDHYISWNNNTTEIGRIALEVNTNRFELFIMGVSVATSVLPMGLYRWARIHVHVNLQSAATGTINVYTDGNLQVPFLTVSATSTNPSSLTFDTVGIGLSAAGRFLDDVIVMDPLDGLGVTDPEKMAYAGVPHRQPNSDGFYSAWTATPGAGSDYEDIDEIPPSDASYIQANAVGQASTFGYEASTSSEVLAAKWKGRFVRSDTVAGLNMNVRRRDVSATTDYDTADIPVPGDGYIFQTFPEKPGGGAWTEADFNDTEFGVVSKT